MFNSRIIGLLFVVGFVTSQAPPSFDKSCMELKTTKRADDCCMIPGAFDVALQKRCFDEIKLTKVASEDIKCLAECIARELGAFKNRTLIKENARKVFETTIGSDANFKPILGDVFEKCYTKVAELIARNDNKNATCHFAPDFLMNCVESGLFENCPAALWNKDAGCVELKEKLKNGCPFLTISDS
ncbi:general odorant-binding protein 67-like [Armigeres subalbatus]|uniref:general odorant-binding protein 67-like n=1 Tax=Armigeres subalbatus TaxID=124917 RepID=UPI002ED03538